MGVTTWSIFLLWIRNFLPVASILACLMVYRVVTQYMVQLFGEESKFHQHDFVPSYPLHYMMIIYLCFFVKASQTMGCFTSLFSLLGWGGSRAIGRIYLFDAFTISCALLSNLRISKVGFPWITCSTCFIPANHEFRSLLLSWFIEIMDIRSLITGCYSLIVSPDSIKGKLLSLKFQEKSARGLVLPLS